MGMIKDIYEIAMDLISRWLRNKSERPTQEEAPRPTEPQLVLTDRGSQGITWEQYDKLYDVEGYRVAYLPILNHWRGDLQFLSMEDVLVTQVEGRFKLEHEFGDAIQPPKDAFDGKCCRLSNYNMSPTGVLSLNFQETSYFDYFRSGEQLDAPFPINPKITNRQALGTLLKKGQAFWAFTHLTNICGVGVFVKTADNYIVGGSVPLTSHVYPGRRTYAVAGVMSWDPRESNPFEAAENKCQTRINYKPKPRHLKLVSFGADARKLYFQFSFLAESQLTVDAFLRSYGNSTSLFSIPFDPNAIVAYFLEHCWEPAAEAALMTVCLSEFGPGNLFKSLFSRRYEWEKREMRDEWDYRASRPGDFPDMSLRYEPHRLQSESKRYVNAVIEFIGARLNDADIVEVGCGTGRITEKLIKNARRVTCVEFCERMVLRSKERLGVLFDPSQYVVTFGQEYYPEHRHDMAICSLVLIHNVTESDFKKLVQSLCRIAKRVFVFEDVRCTRNTSPRTTIRNEESLIQVFAEYGFRLARKGPDYELFTDRISFMEFAEITVK